MSERFSRPTGNNKPSVSYPIPTNSSRHISKKDEISEKMTEVFSESNNILSQLMARSLSERVSTDEIRKSLGIDELFQRIENNIQHRFDAFYNQMVEQYSQLTELIKDTISQEMTKDKLCADGVCAFDFTTSQHANKTEETPETKEDTTEHAPETKEDTTEHAPETKENKTFEKTPKIVELPMSSNTDQETKIQVEEKVSPTTSNTDQETKIQAREKIPQRIPSSLASKYHQKQARTYSSIPPPTWT